MKCQHLAGVTVSSFILVLNQNIILTASLPLKEQLTPVAQDCGSELTWDLLGSFCQVIPSLHAQKCVVVLLPTGYAQDDGGWSSFVSIWVKKTQKTPPGSEGAVCSCTACLGSRAGGSWGRKSRSRNDGSGCIQISSLRKGSPPEIQNCLPQNHS